MENSSDLDIRKTFGTSLKAGFGEASNADCIVGLQQLEGLLEQLVAGIFQGAAKG
jgi:hypothetical protein